MTFRSTDHGEELIEFCSTDDEKQMVSSSTDHGENLIVFNGIVHEELKVSSSPECHEKLVVLNNIMVKSRWHLVASIDRGEELMVFCSTDR